MTASPHLNITCDSYKHRIFSGFTHLQEQQEFVDLTLAADGHMVKVHKNVVALASPYIKELLKTASSDNPIIFLNNVNHDVLKYLLEYIYQGEVNLPQDSLHSFMHLAQSLHITGIYNTNASKNHLQRNHMNQNIGRSLAQRKVENEMAHMQNYYGQYYNQQQQQFSNMAANITINNDHNVEVHQIDTVQSSDNHSNVPLNLNNNDAQIVLNAGTIEAMPVVVAKPENCVEDSGNMEIEVSLQQGDYSNALVANEPTSLLPTIQILSNDKVGSTETNLIDLNMPINLDQETKDALKLITQFSTTERGSVQIIVSRYIYYSHHSSKGGRKRRWRCINYRKLHCPAHIDSFDNRIIARKGLHCHRFHDDVIHQKHKNGKIFTSYKQAEEAWQTEKVTSQNSLDFDNEDIEQC